MRLSVHDYSGHPFQVQLSRELARRGHSVLHEYSTQYVSGHGKLTVTADDPTTLRIEGVRARRPIRKYDPVARMRFELSYARAWQRRMAQQQADVVVACNVPLFALAAARRHFERTRQPWVFWHQDIYSLGVAAEIDRKLPAPIAAPLRRWTGSLERTQVRDATRVVAIGDAFVSQYAAWGLPVDHVEVIPNWAPLEDLVPGPRDNVWAQEQALPSAPVRLLYAGTLGRKHNPLLLLRMLDAVRARGVDAMLVVCSEGQGAEELAAAARDRADVRILGYQPAERFAEVLASADAMLALLEPDAAAFSVPSKVLSYLSAGRPTVALMPETNPAAHDVRTAGGFVGEPTPDGADRAAEWLAATVASGPEALTKLGVRARHLAERRFDIAAITDRFEDVLRAAAGRLRSDLPAVGTNAEECAA
ncbi:MAG TPA: glycosyltransferase family 4 protein [Jatrophihabitans sp.]|nr:glycosyltransferase family 4 protein [Jatrophihabitans sp.]